MAVSAGISVLVVSVLFYLVKEWALVALDILAVGWVRLAFIMSTLNFPRADFVLPLVPFICVYRHFVD